MSLVVYSVNTGGIEQAFKGMRNPMNSWDLSDSWNDGESFVVGKRDLELAASLARSGSSHCKFRRMISVWIDISAPLYFWKEFDTYKVGTVSNSCSTMHSIHKKELTISDFSHEHLNEISTRSLQTTINILNANRDLYLETNDKKYWLQMIQLLPSSYNQRRMVMMNYEVVARIYEERKNHKLDEWHELCKMFEGLPYFEEFVHGAIDILKGE